MHEKWTEMVRRRTGNGIEYLILLNILRSRDLFSTSGLMLISENIELILTWVGVTYLLLWWLNILGLRPEAA